MKTSELRFPWKRAASDRTMLDEVCRKLIERAKETKDEERCTLMLLNKAGRGPCIVCKRVPKKGEWVYYPSVGRSADSTTLGHKDCVDERAGKAEQHIKDQLTVVPMSKPLAAHADVSTDSKSDYYAGWHAGVVFVFDQVSPVMGLTAEWAKGFAEGVMFASQKRGQAS